MPVYKDKNGAWYVMTRCDDWQGQRKQKCKRGFKTKREAQDWERRFLLQQGGDLDMLFKDFYKLYEQDMKARLKQNTWEHKSDALDPAALETKITDLMADKEVTKNSGIYEYLLTGKEKYLSLRQFDEEDARTVYEQQQGICPICGQHFDFEKMHADHITPWHAGGKTVPENLQMLCRDCNLKKSGQI